MARAEVVEKPPNPAAPFPGLDVTFCKGDGPQLGPGPSAGPAPVAGAKLLKKPLPTPLALLIDLLPKGVGVGPR